MSGDNFHMDFGGDDPKGKDPWWIYIIVALIFTGMGLFFYYDLAAWEAEGGSRRLNKLILFIYEYVGKEGVLGTCVIIGILFLYYGFKEFKKISKEKQGR